MATDYKQLIVWQKSMDLAQSIYQLSTALPKEEIYGLVSQMRRCAVSIPSNIAEGSKRGSRKDYAHFLRHAYGSSAELETQILIAQKIYNSKGITKNLDLIIEIQKMLSTIIKKLEL
jgi:four helix bundle protein